MCFVVVVGNKASRIDLLQISQIRADLGLKSQFCVSSPVGFLSVDPAVRKVTFVTVYDQTSCAAECVSLKRSRTLSNLVAAVFRGLGSKRALLFANSDFW